MKKLLPWLFLSFLWGACSNSAPTPVIEVQNLYLNDDKTVDYAPNMETLPLLKVGDVVTVTLSLDGKGESLNTFLVKEDKEIGSSPSVEIGFTDLVESQLSGDQEFTDTANGKLGFIDGVPQAMFSMTAKVNRVVNNEIRLNLYLFSKPVDGEGAKLELKLRTGDVN